MQDQKRAPFIVFGQMVFSGFLNCVKISEQIFILDYNNSITQKQKSPWKYVNQYKNILKHNPVIFLVSKTIICGEAAAGKSSGKIGLFG